MSTNCRNKMKLDDLCQGVGTATKKNIRHMIDSNGKLLPVPFMAFVTMVVSALHGFSAPSALTTYLPALHLAPHHQKATTSALAPA